MDIVFRASAVYAILYLLLRGMGRRELAQLTPFDLVVLIVLGDLVQQGVTQEDMSVTGSILAVGTMCFWMILLSGIAHRWRSLRPLLRGSPILIINKGRPVEAAVSAQGLDLQYIRDAARQQGIADLSQVKFGVLESDGMFSFVRNEDLDSDNEAGVSGKAPAAKS